jgi:hypothetical protein
MFCSNLDPNTSLPTGYDFNWAVMHMLLIHNDAVFLQVNASSLQFSAPTIRLRSIFKKLALNHPLNGSIFDHI